MVTPVVVGGGQSGLSVGYFLQQRGIPFAILEANERVGDNWRKRWDSLLAFAANWAISITLWVKFGFAVFLFCHFLPLLVATTAGAYLFYAQHNFADANIQPRERWSYDRAAIESSSYMEMGPLMHWFTGSLSEARRAVEFGCFFSINPRMALSKNGALVLREIPPSRLLTESDAPFAEAIRGTPSSPGEVQRALDWIAEEKKFLPEQAQNLIVENLRALEKRSAAS